MYMVGGLKRGIFRGGVAYDISGLRVVAGAFKGSVMVNMRYVFA